MLLLHSLSMSAVRGWGAPGWEQVEVRVEVRVEVGAGVGGREAACMQASALGSSLQRIASLIKDRAALHDSVTFTPES